MIYDVPFRHQQALDPSALTTVVATLHAMGKAVDDCRNAGVDPNSDPAVVLLARHMATVSTNRAPRDVLRHACRRRLEDLKRFPTLLALAIRGVEYDAGAKERFHIEATEAMNALTVCIGLAPGTFEIVSLQGERDQSGHVLLAAGEFAVTVRIGARHEGREVAYRAVCDSTSPPNHYAPMADLLKPDRFADRLRRDLSIEVRPVAPVAPVLIAA
ncbi:hypothetical protein U1737_07815 [Sphingomonas sp. LB3N6]|uniref:hypothetical protein n=1 Tax=Sphingomonas fucosidasi TaxID=3096164 RepID=UPI002FC5FE2F